MIRMSRPADLYVYTCVDKAIRVRVVVCMWDDGLLTSVVARTAQ
jgi:hypothetical protein